jgi:hypothetical protein
MGDTTPRATSRPQPGKRPTPTHHQRYSRWQASEITFGPLGRVVLTALLLIPVWFGIFYSAFFLVFAAIYGVWVLPLAYRDVWRKVRATRTPADDLSTQYREAFPDDSPARTDIGTREMPRRW